MSINYTYYAVTSFNEDFIGLKVFRWDPINCYMEYYHSFKEWSKWVGYYVDENHRTQITKKEADRILALENL